MRSSLHKVGKGMEHIRPTDCQVGLESHLPVFVTV
jgi:hypothetical protein